MFKIIGFTAKCMKTDLIYRCEKDFPEGVLRTTLLATFRMASLR